MMVKILTLSTPCLQMSQALTTWFIEAPSKDSVSCLGTDYLSEVTPR